MVYRILKNGMVCIFLVIVFLSSSAFSAEKGLVAYWSFNKCDAKDDSGNGHDGKSVKNPKCVKGVKGKAFNFLNKEDHIEIAHSDDLNLREEYTVSFWIDIDKADYGWKGLDGGWMVAKTKAFDHRGWSITAAPGPRYPENYKIRFIVYEPAKIDDYQYFSKTAFPKNTPTHIAVVGSKSLNKLLIYINGELDKQFEFPGITSANEHPVWIGAHYGIEDRQIDGIVDEVRIYNRALIEHEIKELYKLKY